MMINPAISLLFALDGALYAGFPIEPEVIVVPEGVTLLQAYSDSERNSTDTESKKPLNIDAANPSAVTLFNPEGKWIMAGDVDSVASHEALPYAKCTYRPFPADTVAFIQEGRRLVELLSEIADAGRTPSAEQMTEESTATSPDEPNASGLLVMTGDTERAESGMAIVPTSAASEPAAVNPPWRCTFLSSNEDPVTTWEAISHFFSIEKASNDDMQFLLCARRYGISHAKHEAVAFGWKCGRAIAAAERFAR